MPSQYIFSTASNVDLSAQVRAYRTVMTANAEEGSVAISTVIIDDMLGGLNITGDSPFTWNETSESSNSTIIQHGYFADRDVSRGPFRVGNSRQWSCNVADINSILNRRLVLLGSGNRPAETDVARMQWVVSSTGLGTYVTDTTYLSTANPVAMDANDYRNQRVFDVVDDCAQQSGKNYFLLINELIAGKPTGIFYDFNNSTAYASPVRLTNVLADVDSTTTFAVYNDDLKLNRDPSRVYSQVVVPYQGGQELVNSDAIAALFFPRDVVAPAINVHSAAKARARGLRYLNDISTEEDRLTMSYLVPLARVNRLREGHTFQVKFSHLPGYQGWTFVRALKRTVEAISEEFYKVTLEAAPAAGSALPGGSCATAITSGSAYDSGNVDIGTHDWSAGPLIQTVSLSPSTASAIVAIIAAREHSFTPSDFNGVDTSYTRLGTSVLGDLGIAGYRANTTTGGTFSATFTGGDCDHQVVVAASIPTGGSIVQNAEQIGTGGTVTLGATPTSGNILIMASLLLGGTVASPTGWTTLVNDSSMVSYDGTHGVSVNICAKCVSGDTSTIAVPNGARYHSSWVSEWTIV